MKKIYCLSSCDTCRAILKNIRAVARGFVLQDIKTQPITPKQLEELSKMAGSYEALFSRRAIKYRELNLKAKLLTENDYRRYILDEYTFLKRPVVILKDKLFVGSDQHTIEGLQKALGG